MGMGEGIGVARDRGTGWFGVREGCLAGVRAGW